MFGLIKNKNRVQPVWSKTIGDHVIDLAWSSDGQHLASAASTGSVGLFDAKTGSATALLSGHELGTLALSWSPTGPTLATAGKDRRVRLWDTLGREMACLEAASNWVERLAWLPDGSILAATAGRTVHLWKSNGDHIVDLTDHPSTVSDLAWRPNSRTLAVLVYGGVMLWTLHKHNPPTFQLFPWKGSPLRLAWSPDGTMLAHGNQDATVHFWYAETGEDLQMSGYSTKVREISWNSTSRYLATGGGPIVCVWDCGGNGPAGTTPLMLDDVDANFNLTAVKFQTQGQLLASADAVGRIRVWEPLRKQQPLIGNANGDSEATVMSWSPNNKSLAVGNESGTVTVYQIL